MDTVLQSLRDIQGVLGSFLLDELGQVIARDMPSVFDEQTLAQASLRLSQLRGAFEAGGEARGSARGSDNFEGCTARFGGHLLVLRAAEARTLCVLCPVGTNLSTLTMGINLVSRRVAAPRRSPSLPPPAPAFTMSPTGAPIMAPISPTGSGPAPVPTPPPSAPVRESLPPEPMSTTRFFRGRPVP